MTQPIARCVDCGRQLTPAPARFDGDPTYVGYFKCECNNARAEDRDREFWKGWAWCRYCGDATPIGEVCEKCAKGNDPFAITD